MVLSATLTQDPSKLAQLDLHHPLLLTTGNMRYQLPGKLESYKLVCYHCFIGNSATPLKMLLVPSQIQ